MSDAREEVLERVRAGLRDVSATDPGAVTRSYRRTGTLRDAELIELLARRVEDYRASVKRVASGEVATAVSRLCAERGLRRLAVPAGLDPRWLPGDVEVVVDEGLTPQELDEIDGALTGCAVAIAETGTLALDGGPSSGRRVLTLVPDHHICVVLAEQTVEGVPEAMERLRPAAAAGAPVTLVSGPSASSDIELERVEGVHGPRHLVVLLVSA